MDPFNFNLQDNTERLRESAQQLFSSSAQQDPFNIKHDLGSSESVQQFNTTSNNMNQANYRNHNQMPQAAPIYFLPYPQQQNGRPNQQQPTFFYNPSFNSYPFAESNLPSAFTKVNQSTPSFVNHPYNFIQPIQNISNNRILRNDSDSNPNSPSSSDEEIAQVPPKEMPKPRPVARTRGGRIQWTPDLHAVFEECVEALGVAATAKNVMTLMVSRGADIGGLTRVKVANHLQYYNSRKNKSIVSKLSDKRSEAVEVS